MDICLVFQKLLTIPSVNDLALHVAQNSLFLFAALGPVPQKSVNANLRLKVNHAVYFSAPRCCSTLIIGKTLHERKSILKSKNKRKKPSPKC